MSQSNDTIWDRMGINPPPDVVAKALPTMFRMVQEFYDRMGFRRPARPTRIPAERRKDLMGYILSESLEFGSARELHDQVDAAVDMLYFIMDIFVELGVDPAVPFQIVHEANMAKLWPDGEAHFDHSVVPPRLIKPDGWERPEPAIHDYLKELLHD